MEKRILIIILLFICFLECIAQYKFEVTYENDYNEKLINKNIKTSNNNFLKSFSESPESITNKNIDKMRPLLKMCVGNPKQCFNFLIQTNSFHILLSDIDSKLQTCSNKFEWRNSTSLVKKQIEVSLRYYNTRVVGWEAIDDFYTDKTDNGKNSYGKLLFLVISEGGKYPNEEGILGLGYNPSDEEKKYSFIEQLFNKGKIPHKVFSHKITGDESGFITIGMIPENIVKDYYHYGRCRALDKIRNGKNYKNNNWECHLDYILFGNNKIEIEGLNINFLAFRKRSFLPKNIMNIFYENYFKKYIDERKCIIHTVDNVEEKPYKYLECMNDVIFEPLTLVFGDWQITFNDNDLFEYSVNSPLKRFVFCYKENYEKFLFGLSILTGIEMVYDYANKEIGFYNENVKYIGKDQNPPPPKVYDFLEDDEEAQAKLVKNEEKNLLPETEIEEKKEDNVTVVNAGTKISLLKILEKILQGGIILTGFIIAGFLVIIGMKFKNRKKLKEAQKYLKKKLVDEKS